MELIRAYVPTLAGAIAAVLLQLLLAPYMTIGYAMVNFILCYVVIMAIFRAEKQGYIMPFVLGLAYDLMGEGTIGAMALVCVVLTFAISRVYLMLASDSYLVSVVLVVLGCLLGELAYGLLLILCGADVGLLEALGYRMLPCALYDTVVSSIAFLLISRFAFASKKSEPMQVIR